MLTSGIPSGSLISIGRYAKSINLTFQLIYIDPNLNDTVLDCNIINFPYKRISRQKSVNKIRDFFSRLYALLKAFLIIKKEVRAGDILISNSIDTLCLCYAISLVKPIRIRYIVRDLIYIQFGSSMFSRFTRFVDKHLVKQCELLATSSIRFYERYYAQFYQGEVVQYDNWPSIDLIPRKKTIEEIDKPIVLGFIGIIRYLDSFNIIRKAVDKINIEGCRFKLLIAGGGDWPFPLDKYVIRKEKYMFSLEIQNLYDQIDINVAVYDKTDPNCQLAIPNKLWESISTQTPLIVSSGTYLGEVVEKMGIGKAIPNDLEATIDILLDVYREDSWYKKAKTKLSNIDIAKFKLMQQESIKIILKDA